MNKVYELLIKCVASSLGSNVAVTEQPDEQTMEQLYAASKKHSVIPLVYDGINRLQISFPTDDLKTKFKRLNARYAMQYVLQDEQLKHITSEFESAHIRNMPLKGSILRAMYPSPELRTSSDIDILYDEENRSKVEKIFAAFGYQPGEEEAKDISYKKPPLVNIEMHHSLMGDHPEIEGDFADVWDRCHTVDGSDYSYEMTDEDFYVYMIVHAAKHYLMGGIGIRFVADAFVFLRARGENMDMQSVENKLKKHKCSTFNRKITELAYHWFANGASDETTEALGDFICGCGIFGNAENRVANQIANGGSGFILRRIFPSYTTMCCYFPKLENHGILLPYYWAKRIVNSAFKRNTKFFDEAKIKSSITEEKINSAKKLNDELGFSDQTLKY